MQTLNEDAVKSIVDLIDIAKGAIDTAQNGLQKSNYSYSSAAKAASNLVAVFPVLCSTNVSADTASLITRLMERKGATILQLALMASGITNAQNGIEFLRQFHQNLDVAGSDLDSMMKTLNDYYGESAEVPYAKVQGILRTIQESSVLGFYDQDYNEISLNDYLISESKYSVNDLTVTFKPAALERIHEADYSQYSKIKPMSKEDKERYAKNADTAAGDVAYRNQAKRDALGKYNQGQVTGSSLQNRDIDKINSDVPALMIVKFHNVQTDTDINFLIGIKAKLIPCNYSEIANRIRRNNDDHKGLANLIRLTSGELSFVRDVLFAIDRSRDDVLSRRTKGSKEEVWKTLENRAQKSKMYTRQNKVNMASAITTVVISAEDADMLYKEYNIDMQNPKVAQQFMSSYNLLGFAIANDANESLQIIYDEGGDSQFETLAYRMLERENGDGQYRKIVNLLSKTV